MTPPSLAARLHSLPPILHRTVQASTSSCSKAPRGLFVLLRVGRIYTANSISPSPWLRQRSSRYTIRAGQNLPDKEFRYLRTVLYVNIDPTSVNAAITALHVAMEIGPYHRTTKQAALVIASCSLSVWPLRILSSVQGWLHPHTFGAWHHHRSYRCGCAALHANRRTFDASRLEAAQPTP